MDVRINVWSVVSLYKCGYAYMSNVIYVYIVCMVFVYVRCECIVHTLHVRTYIPIHIQDVHPVGRSTIDLCLTLVGSGSVLTCSVGYVKGHTKAVRSLERNTQRFI